jgi:hypothetical protein
MTVRFPDLPQPRELIVDEPFWQYQPLYVTSGGAAHLRIWSTRANHKQLLAMVTELGLGPSITNSIENIWQVLAGQYPDTEIVLLEHYPAAESLGEEHLDQVVVDQHAPDWRRIWPCAPANPNVESFSQWMTAFGPLAGIPAS